MVTEERTNGMRDKRKTIAAKTRTTASADKFQAYLDPTEILDEDAIVAEWAASAGLGTIQAKTALTSLECFIMEELGKGRQLNFGLVSFYPRLSGALKRDQVRGRYLVKEPVDPCRAVLIRHFF